MALLEVWSAKEFINSLQIFLHPEAVIFHSCTCHMSCIFQVFHLSCHGSYINFHFYEGSSSTTETRGRITESTRELRALTDRRRSRSRRRRRDAPPDSWIGSTTRSLEPVTDLTTTVQNPEPQVYSASSVYQYPPEQWLGANFQTIGENAAPGDLRASRTQG